MQVSLPRGAHEMFCDSAETKLNGDINKTSESENQLQNYYLPLTWGLKG
jgi:hypothetical protein